MALLFGIKARLLDLFWHAGPRPLVLHASAVCRNQRGLLLLGPDGAGKTTLALTLGARGFEIYSDEYAVIDQQQFHVIPYPAPMAIKDSPLLPTQYGAKIRAHLIERNIFSNVIEPDKRLLPLAIQRSPKPCPLVHIFMLGKPTLDGNIQVSRIDPDALVELFSKPPDRTGEFYLHTSIGGETRIDRVKTFIRAVRGIAISEISRGEIQAMADTIEAIHRDRSASNAL